MELLMKPVNDVDKLQKWIRCDYMVTCWILNLMITELSKAFLYAQSAAELWKEIAERYGQSNGPLVYQLERELSRITQGSLSIAAYFNKLKKCWDELHTINGMPVCTCGKLRECSCGLLDKFVKLEERSKLVQFLMKLNDDYENVRSQILAMDPLPSVNKAYYIVQQIERQKQVTTYVPEPTAFFANKKNGLGGKRDFKGPKFELKTEMKRHCTYCDEDGHYSEQFFERVGYPDWYKGKKNMKKGKRLAAQVAAGYEFNTPFDLSSESGVNAAIGDGGLDQKLVNAVCQEVMKMFKGQIQMQDPGITSTSTQHAGPFN